MQNLDSKRKNIILAALVGAIVGGIATLILTEAIPRITSRMMASMMENMMARMEAGDGELPEMCREMMARCAQSESDPS